MILLVSLILCSKSIAAANSASLEDAVNPKDFLEVPSPEEIISVKKGYETPYDGYFMSIETGRDVLTAWAIAEKKADYLEKKVEELLNNQQAFIVSVSEKTDSISDAAQKALAEKDRQIKAERAKAKRPGIGVFAGVGYTTDSNVEGVVGVGLVFKIW